jgi:hypothetical protein
MTENVEFTPEQQAKIDEIVKQRVARERERLEKESGVEDLKAQLAAKDEEIADLKRQHDLDYTRRALLQELDQRGVDAGRREHIMKLVDLDAIEVRPGGEVAREDILEQIDGVAKDLPELVRPRGAGSGGSSKPVVPHEPALTRDDVEKMSEEEINSRWDQVKAFLAGERG